MTMLTYERANELLRYDAETGELFWRIAVSRNVKAGEVAGRIRSRDRYKILTINKKQYQSHRVIWLLMTGNHPVMFIDHINGDRTDNRFCNLREADRHINAQNVRTVGKRNTSGYLGVSFKRGAYEASLRIGKKNIYLGRFDDPKIAHEAYVKAKRQLHVGCTL